jgi:hypothetical protein
MKKVLSIVTVLVLLGGLLTAQESGGQQQQGAAQSAQAQGGEAQAAAPAQYAAPFPTRQPIKIGMGDLMIDGRIMTGIRSQTTNTDGEDGNTSLEAINAEWQENRIELNLDYSLGNYGAFVLLQARNFGGNAFAANDAIKPRFALVYANFLDNKIKVSLGKLYDDIYQKRPSEGTIWKTEGPGALFRFTDEERFSARIEFKPIAGLNVGAQLFFVDNAISPGQSAPGKDLWDTEALKEIGIGVTYNNPKLFNAQFGLRLDSKVDPMDRTEAKTYLPQYYGDGNMMGTAGAMLLKYKHLADIGSVTGLPANPAWTPAVDNYNGGHWAFLGFKLNAVKNLDVTAHGALYNLGAFDKFGYGRIAEFVKYNNIVPGLGVGITLEQEFYGGDVMKDGIINSPFLRFTPQVSYKYNIFVPSLEGGVGISPDVLDIYYSVKPQLQVSLNRFVDVCVVKVFYELIHHDFVDSLNIDTTTKHTVGVAVDLIF